MRAGQNPVDILCNLPAVAPAGSFFVTDPFGISPYGYICFGQSSFYQIDLGSGALRRLPDLPAALVFGPGVTACWSYAGPNGRGETLDIIGPGVAGPTFAYTGRYDPFNGAWAVTGAAGTLTALLAATWGTDAASCFVGLPSHGTANAYVLLRGSGLNTSYRLNIVGNAWAATGGVPGVVSGAGCTMAATWGYAGDDLYAYSTHGGGNVALRRYGVAADAWAAVVPDPVLVDAPNTGTCSCTHPNGRLVLIRLNATGQILAYNPNTMDIVGGDDVVYPYARIYGPDGTATVGNKLCSWKQNGDTYLGVILHGSSQVQRIRIVE